jgi:hypothetical protein
MITLREQNCREAPPVPRDLGLGSLEDARPAPAGFITERVMRITGLLAGPQRERHRDFAGMMACSSFAARRDR